MAKRPDRQEFAALLTRVREGDGAALTQLITHYEAEIRIAARVRLGAALRPYLDPADVVQSVHRSLISGLKKDKFDLSSPEKLISLAVTLVQRKIARQWRRCKRQTRADSGGAGADPSEAILELCSPEEGPASAVRSKEAVDNFLKTLDDIDRRVVELRIDGYSTAEAAERLGLTAHFVRMRLARLRKHLVEAGLLHDWL
jgi:RNA polymerase sigma-70 factor (ECF subfamily)